MEIVSPGTEHKTTTTDSLTVEKKAEEPLVIKKETDSPTLKIKKDTVSEEITTIETNLYTASISSLGGGSIKNFYLNNYFKEDSSRVDLIRSGTNPNLLLSVKDLDGNNINLSGPWEVESKKTRNTTSDISEIVFKKEVLESRFIYKTLTFYPDTYTISISTDISSVRNFIFRDVSFGWYGGLNSTEKNTQDDETYFKSYVFMGDELEELKSNKSENLVFNGPTDWVSLRTKYFTSAIIPKEPQKTRGSALSSSLDSLEKYSGVFVFDVNNPVDFTVYLGPLEYDRIRSLGVGLDKTMDFGWAFIIPISKGVLYLLKKMHQFIPNYGYVLILFSFLVKILVYPLTKKSYQSTAAMQAVQPEINKLKEKHKSNPQKLNQATMALYKEKGVNPLGGCLPMLLQMPLLFALFIVFRTTIELRAEPFIFWITDLSAPDVVFSLPFSIPIYGQHVAIMPILMVVSMFIQQSMMSGGTQQPQQKTLQYFMTGFFFLMFNTFPSGLNLYYTLFNVLTIAQQKLAPNN